MVKQKFSLRNGYVVIFGLLLNIGTSQATAALQYSTAAAPAAHRGAARQMYGSGSLRPPGTRQPPIYATGRRDHGSRTTPPSSQEGPPNLYRSPYQPTFDVQHYPRVPLPVPLHELEAAGYPFYLLPAPGMVRLSDRPSLRGGQYGGRPEYYQGRPQQGGIFLHDLGLVMGRGFDKRIATMLGPVRRRGSIPIEGGQITLDETTGNLHHPCGEDCARGEYLCVGSCTCIPNEYRCDGDVDCQGQEDELECGEPELSDSKRCEDSSKHVRCPTTGRCISREFICDGDDDCGDYSDETKCGTKLKCNEDQFECNNGLCIPNNWICDTDNDCKDFSDEFNCSKIGCTKDEFECGDGTCISLTWKCDKEVDCSDESDETDCDILPSCNDEEFQCSSDKCIKRIFRCDGDNDCGDWSDESECEIKPDSCLSGEFKCENGKCIPERYVCDKQQDCDNNEDEDKCENVPLQSCSPEEHVCDSGACILKTWVCDGFEDCSRGEDELSCDIICDDAKYPCQSLKNNKTAFCINKKHVCDGQKDCPRGEDEMNCPTKIDCAKDSKCEQLCLKTHEGKDACNCRAGYRLADDEYSCEDINECLYATDPVCSQTCNNTIGSFRCGCMTGYILRPDLRSCKATGAPPTLLFANRKDIRQVSLSSTKYTAILKGLQNAIALDYHYEQGLIFWSDVSMDVIRRAYINGTDIIDVITSGLESPAGLAVDWIHGLLFWTDSGTRRVEVSTLDGRARHVVAARDLDKPRAIAVHPGRGLLLWTDWGPRPRIERSDMDGGNRKSLITESVFWPNGLAIDYTSERIYWADAKHNVIETATLDGADRRKVISKGLPHPFAITLFEDAIYWTDWHTKSISTANKVTGAGLRTVHSQLHFPMDIRSYHPQRQPQYPNRCAGNCDHLCLPTSEGHKCVCRLGQRLRSNKRGCQHPERLLLFSRNKDLRILNLPTSDQDPSVELDYKEHHMVIPVEGVKSAVAIAWDSHTDSIFWTDIERDTINRAFWNGTGHQILVQSNLASPAGLAFDWLTNKLYWTDAINCRIEVANSDGSLRALLIWKDLYEPRDIALDPLNGYMYWTVWGNKSRIERAAMDGTMRTVILDTNLTWPNGLAIDYEAKKLYWADAGTRTIEYSDLNGSHRHLLLDGGPESHPFGLDVHGRWVFWTDWRSRRIERVDKLKGTDRTVLVSDLSDLMDVRVFHRERSYVGTPCNSKNGGCSHLCLLKPGGTQCACPIGITLGDDGKTCSSGPVNYLIFARRVDIRQISLDVPYTMDAVLPFSHLKSATSVDVDRKTGEIYWTDTAEDVIEKASPDGQNVKTVIMHELEAPDGLAVDSTGRKIYWTDRVRNSIEVAELNGGNRKVLFCTHLDNPRAITLHYHHGLVFWTDWGKSAKIEVAHMDGANRQVLITKNLAWPNGLAIDRPMERLYWNDGKLNVIESSDLNGMNRRIVRSKVKHPYGLVVVGSHIYWTDWQTQALHRADKNDGSEMTVIRDKLEGLMDVRSVQADNIEENACGDNNGGCSHLCLRNPTGYTCACPTGIKMTKNNNKKCKIQPDSYILIATRYSLSRISLDFEELWDVTLQLKDVQNLIGVDFHWKKKMIFYTDIGKNVIGSINMNDISEMKPVIKEDLLSPDGIAIDWLADNLYWTNTGKKLIEVSRFDGSSRKVLIRDSLDDPRSITVYPRKAYLFWSDWGQPRIERSLLDGSSRRVLIGELLSFPIGLAIDYSLDRLYWIDAKLKAERVEASDLHGRFREFLEYMPSTHPFSLVTHGRYIYWTDWAQKAILRADKNTGKDSRVLRSHLDAAMGLTVVAAERQQGWNPCMMDNGGCQHLCFYTVKNYSCGCSDQQPNCKTEPISAVPLSCPGPPHDCAHWDDPSTAVDEHYIHPSLFAPPSGSDSPSSAATTPSSLLYAVTLVPAISVMALCIALALYLMTRRSREGYPYARGSGRGPGRGFSNPNYCSSVAGQDQQQGGQGSERKQRMWKRLKYDKSQERVYEETTGTNSPEVLSLIPTVLTPCSSNCEPVTPELERSPLATPLHKPGVMVTQTAA